MAGNALPHSLNIHGISATDGAQIFAGINLGTVNYAPSKKESLALNEVLDTLPVAKDAPFNSYQRQHEPTCLPDTRVDLLREIHDWADDEDSPGIFWLSGLAGTGKSTIAQTVAEHYHEEGQLAASFFFSRAGGDINHAGKFMTSIASQIANSIPDLRHKVCDAISKHRHIASLSIAHQWRELVFDPISTIQNQEHSSSYIVVVDALDECAGQDDVHVILQRLAEVQSLRHTRLRVLLTSRPEIPIQYGFTQIRKDRYQDFILHEIQPAVIEHDISVFLRHELGQIIRKHGVGIEWPNETAIARLSKNSGGLFIWAATALRFVDEDSQLVETRLHSLINQEGSDILPPERKLDEIYTTVLASSFHGNHNEEEIQALRRLFRQVVGSIVILQDSLSVDQLAELLGIDSAVVRKTLARLHSVLHVPASETGSIQLLHPSFRDFLLDQGRCSELDFYIDERLVHSEMAEHCVRSMSKHLHRDMCNLQDPGILIADLGWFDIDQYVQPHLQYACRFWVHHLRRSDVDINKCSDVGTLLQKHFLHWLETLTLLNCGSDAVHMIRMLNKMTNSIRRLSLQALIQDAVRFAAAFRPIIEEAPLQLYYAGLAFSPRASLIKEIFSNEATVRRFSLPLDKTGDWSSYLHKVKGCDPQASSVPVMPDRKPLVSGFRDMRVRLWKTSAGRTLQTLRSHSDWVKCVAFSSDGKIIASGSLDKTVKIWDVCSGTVLRTLKGHSGAILSVAFSPDSKTLASTSRDKTVRIWDVGSGKVLQTLEGHLDWVNCVAFSPDGKIVASGSDDKTVKIWDAGSGRDLRTLLNTPSLVTSVAFSPDGKTLAVGFYKVVWLWDMELESWQWGFHGLPDWVNSVAFSPDGKTLAARSNKMMKLWDAGVESTRTLRGYSGPSKRLWSQSASTLPLSVVDEWVYKYGQRSLWIPPKYRTSTVAVCKNALAFGYPSGRILIFKL
ncbi:hypothetical protein BU24DRAFT_481180 [Aaosphaeria arxii CBS 175.79]|uniref:Nephrocystin 3-like N-terminal domain-containing protein n=1 Tax=Aaosphaeria arxii CBS 175.79 TaxID=1450172 RepID=A0A6A5XUC6_9PLEO|nr:uncharacterized protein BU24DRAFT_481180 [Aaosphaeria arxii CBS 175.79]KAF2016553.1 hypothetical protein BU24DRAFT_481180 [Aaosphaeria arxii CBS 175.79]